MTLSRYDNWKLDTPAHYKEGGAAECQRCGADFTDDEGAALCGPCGEELDLQAADPDWCEVCDGERTHGCDACNGSGEGMTDGTSCPACGGAGETDCECAADDDEDDDFDEPDDREADAGDYDRAADAYECETGGGR